MTMPPSVTDTLLSVGAAAPGGASFGRVRDRHGMESSVRRRSPPISRPRPSPKSRYRHMTPEIADEIRRRYFAREATQADLGRQYGIRQHSVSRIVSGLSWARPGPRCATRAPADGCRGSGGSGVPRR